MAPSRRPSPRCVKRTEPGPPVPGPESQWKHSGGQGGTRAAASGMGAAFDELLEATIRHLAALQANGERCVCVSPARLAALTAARPATRKDKDPVPGPARPASRQAIPEPAAPAAPDLPAAPSLPAPEIVG